MSAQLVIRRSNGKPHFSVEHDGPSRVPRLDRELARIDVQPSIATLPLEEIVILWAKGVLK